MNIQQNRKRRSSFNVIDALILFVTLALVAALVYGLFFTDLSQEAPTAQEGEKRVVYTIEIAPIESDFLSADGALPFVSGDRFWNATDSYLLGTIVNVGELTPYYVSTGKYVTDENGAEVLQYAPFPGMSTVQIRVEATALFEDGAYQIDGHILRVGDEFDFHTPYFKGKGSCVSLEEVSDRA